MDSALTAAVLAKDKIVSVQALRFVAAFAIVFSHVADLVLPKGSLVMQFPWTIGVHIFFVISGFIMQRLTDGQAGQPGVSRRFMIRRVIRIVPPYWIVTIATIGIIAILGGQVRNTQLDPLVIIASFLFIPWPRADGKLNPIVSQGWTLNYEMFFYAAFALALSFRKGIVWLAFAFVMFAFASIFIPGSWFVPAFLSRPIILEFVAGIGLSWVYGKAWRMPLPAAIACVAIAIILLLLPQIIHLSDALGTFCLMFGPALLCTGVLLCRPIDLLPSASRLCVAGGDISYALYLTHYLVVNAVTLVATRLGNIPALYQIVAGVIASIITAWLFYRLIERPMTNMLHAKLAAG